MKIEKKLASLLLSLALVFTSGLDSSCIKIRHGINSFRLYFRIVVLVLELATI